MEGHGKKIESHGAILIVTVGTTQSEGRAVIGRYMEKVKSAYPKADVRCAFISEPVRLVLKEQGEEVLGPLAGISTLLDKGHSQVVVQPLFLTPGGQYHDLYPIVSSLNELAGAHGALGFQGILIGSPLFLNAEDYFETAEAIKSIYSDLVSDEAVVLVSPRSEGGADPSLCQLQMVIDDLTKTGKIVIGAVDGYPDLQKVTSRLSHIRAKKVRLVPLAIVPGIHAWIEIAGEKNKESWQKALETEGYTVTVDSKGLGEYDGILDLFMKRLKDRAESHSFLK